MRVKFINPTNKKFGTVEHIENTAGRTLIAMGEAEAVPYKDFRERLAAEAAVGSHSTNVNPGVLGTEWGLIPSETSSFRQDVVVKREGASTTYYSDCPPEAPAAIKKQWADLKGLDRFANVRAVEKAKADGAEYYERSKTFKRW
jgi:hypothetical protein